MFTLRATRKLLALMKAKPQSVSLPPTTVLGDWYANVTNDGLVLCVSEKTLLPVVLPGLAIRTLTTDLPRAMAVVLEVLGVDKTAIERERFAMAQAAVSTTASRRVVGFLNEFAFMMEAGRDEHRSLVEVAVDLARTPCNASSPNTTWPDQATRETFSV